MSTRRRIASIEITPVAFRDPPLLNNVGVHEPFAIRAIVEVHTDQGLTGLGETYADSVHLQRLHRVAELLPGADVWDLHELARQVRVSLQSDTRIDGGGTAGMVTADVADKVLSPFEVACLNLQGQETGLPVSALLGGAVRDRVEYSAYLFYRWAGHPGAEPDDWGEALDPDSVVAQARKMIDEYGFSAIKVKGGVFEPDREIETVIALREAFPEHPLRLDPNAAWTVETAVRVGGELDGVLEYLKDPDEDVVRAGVLRFEKGSVAVPMTPGLGSSSIPHGLPPCTSSTSPAASGTATIPATCDASTRLSRCGRGEREAVSPQDPSHRGSGGALHSRRQPLRSENGGTAVHYSYSGEQSDEHLSPRRGSGMHPGLRVVVGVPDPTIGIGRAGR